MKKVHKDKLQKNLVQLTKLNIIEMLPYLLNGVISKHQKQELEAIKVPHTRARHFVMNMLMQKPEAAYHRFIQVLAAIGQTDLLCLLEDKEIPTFINKGRN